MLSRSRHRRCLVTVFFVSLLLLGLAQGQDSGARKIALQIQMDSLKNGKDCERRSAVRALHRFGKQAIPGLLERITDSQLAKSSALLLQNPLLSSVLPKSQHDEFAGVLYAYTIELILGREVLSTEAGRCEFLLGQDDYLYGHGVIRKDPNEALAPIDLSRIQQIYSAWWDANRNKTLAQLRADWKRSARPLSGSKYRWF